MSQEQVVYQDQFLILLSFYCIGFSLITEKRKIANNAVEFDAKTYGFARLTATLAPKDNNYGCTKSIH